MAVEKKWLSILPVPFTQNGTQFGVVTIANTIGFKTKQSIFLSGVGLPQIQLQVKRVISSTQLIVGPVDNKVDTNDYTNISAYTVVINSTIGAAEQIKNNIPDKDHYIAVYEGDPIVADRVIQVDPYGNFYNNSNPLPVSFQGSVSIGAVEIKGTNNNYLEPNVDGSINVNVITSPVAGQNVISRYNEVTSVASGIETQIVFYVVPAGKTAILQRINTSGENVGRYRVYLNGVPFDTQRTYFGGEFNALFEYTTGTTSGFVLNSSDVVSVKILHSRPSVGNFEARIQALEIT